MRQGKNSQENSSAVLLGIHRYFIGSNREVTGVSCVGAVGDFDQVLQKVRDLWGKVENGFPGTRKIKGHTARIVKRLAKLTTWIEQRMKLSTRF